jgi:hypothetical protein
MTTLKKAGIHADPGEPPHRKPGHSEQLSLPLHSPRQDRPSGVSSHAITHSYSQHGFHQCTQPLHSAPVLFDLDPRFFSPAPIHLTMHLRSKRRNEAIVTMGKIYRLSKLDSPLMVKASKRRNKAIGNMGNLYRMYETTRCCVAVSAERRNEAIVNLGEIDRLFLLCYSGPGRARHSSEVGPACGGGGSWRMHARATTATRCRQSTGLRDCRKVAGALSTRMDDGRGSAPVR